MALRASREQRPDLPPRRQIRRRWPAARGCNSQCEICVAKASVSTVGGDVTRAHVELLADHSDLIPIVGEMRWHEWGQDADWGEDAERNELGWWVDVTASESGRDDLPVTFVAVDAHGAAVGAVGLGHFDPEERRDRSPWVLGMIVLPQLRRRRVGRLLLESLAGWAGSHGYQALWVATGDPAVGFYQSCAWELAETFARPTETVHVLTTNARLQA
jgi:GNAT superfamily N-acetyltransferase